MILPQDFAGVGVERDKRAAKLAALIFFIASRSFFNRRYWHIEPVAIEHGSARQSRHRMLIHFRVPEWLAGLRIHCMDERLVVAKVSREFGYSGIRLSRQRTDADRRSHSPSRVQLPIGATRLRIQAINHPGRARDVE